MRKTYLFKSATLLIVMIAGINLSQAQSLIRNPIAWYPFDETDTTLTTTADASGNGLDGTIMDNDSLETGGDFVEGYLGNGLLFDGTAPEKMVMLPFDGLELYSDQGSFSVWIKGYAGGGLRGIFSGGPLFGDAGGFGPLAVIHAHVEGSGGSIWAGGELSYLLRTSADDSDSTFFFLYSDPDKFYSVEGGAPAGTDYVNPISVEDSTWHHVACTWGGGKGQMYIDGSLIVEDTYVPDFVPYKLSYINLGNMLGVGGNRNFVGILDEFRLYDDVLTEDDVEMIFNNEGLVLDNNIVTEQFNVYPNPASAEMNVKFLASKSQEVSATLTNLSGQTVLSNTYRASVGTNNLNLNVSTFERGVYFLKLVVDGRSELSKVILK